MSRVEARGRGDGKSWRGVKEEGGGGNNERELKRKDGGRKKISIKREVWGIKNREKEGWLEKRE